MRQLYVVGAVRSTKRQRNHVIDSRVRLYGLETQLADPPIALEDISIPIRLNERRSLSSTTSHGRSFIALGVTRVTNTIPLAFLLRITQLISTRSRAPRLPLTLLVCLVIRSHISFALRSLPSLDRRRHQSAPPIPGLVPTAPPGIRISVPPRTGRSRPALALASSDHPNFRASISPAISPIA
jgi:hypothetical protein